MWQPRPHLSAADAVPVVELRALRVEQHLAGGGGGGGQACQVLAQLMRGQGARASTLSPLSTRLGRMPGLFFGQAWECITNSSSTEKTTPTGPPSPRPNPGQEPVAIYSPQPPPVLTRLRRSKK